MPPNAPPAIAMSRSTMNDDVSSLLRRTILEALQYTRAHVLTEDSLRVEVGRASEGAVDRLGRGPLVQVLVT